MPAATTASLWGRAKKGRQELMGELLFDVPGALWMRDQLDELRRSQAPELQRIVVAIDRSGTGGEEQMNAA